MRNAFVYEVNMRQYTAGGSLAEFRHHLPRLKALGVGVLWIMPVQTVGKLNRKGTLGSPYSISNYHEIDPLYGNFDEFVELVNEIHRQGMYVILDWVANHTAWDHHWVSEHPEYYRRNGSGEVFPPFPEWEDVIGLDYDSPGLRKAMIEEMDFWITKAHIDGFRCDMAMLVPLSFWQEAAQLLNKRKRFILLAEADQRELAEAFDVLYNWNLHHAFNRIAQGEMGALQLREMLQSEILDFPDKSDNLLFLSNHDENSWNGSAVERMANALEAMSVLSFTLPGVPMVYSGMEAGNYRRLSFFEKDCIEWKDDKMAGLFANLARLKHDNPAMYSPQGKLGFSIVGTSRDDKVFCFLRQNGPRKVLAMINLSNEWVNCSLPDTQIDEPWVNFFPLRPYNEFALEQNLRPWDYRVWTQN